MRYITADEFCAYLGKRALLQLTDGVGESLNEALLEEVNDAAAGEVDGFLRGVYVLPLVEPVDPIIRMLTAEIMKFRLYKRRDEKNLPEVIFKLYELTTNRLLDIQARRFVLGALAITQDAAHTPTLEIG